jgi:hypothetical protein
MNLSEHKNRNLRPPGFRLREWQALAVIVVACVAGYLLLRIPELRNWFLSLTPHRWHTPFVRQRQYLAPRSILFSGAILAVVIAGLSFFAVTRHQLLFPLNHRQVFATFFGAVMSAIALAVFINLESYFFERYRKPIWEISDSEVLSYILPQTWPDSRRLMHELPPGARIALQAPNEFLYWIPALCYPLEFYHDFSGGPNWTHSSTFPDFAKKYGLTYILDYKGFDRSHPYDLVPVQAK